MEPTKYQIDYSRLEGKISNIYSNRDVQDIIAKYNLTDTYLTFYNIYQNLSNNPNNIQPLYDQARILQNFSSNISGTEFVKQQAILPQKRLNEYLNNNFLNMLNSRLPTYQVGGFVTVLGYRRKIVIKGKTKYVNIKGEMVPLSKAKAMEKTKKK